MIAFLTVIVGLVVTLAVYIGVAGLAVMLLWTWFVVPLGVPALSLSESAGVALLGRLMSYQFLETKDRGAVAKFGIWFPISCIAFGFLIHLAAVNFGF